MSIPYDESLIWIVVIGFIVAFVLAFGIGANDVANSFGTSVGAGVLTIFQACILATFFEIAGAVLIGYKVSDTMRKGILDVSLYEGHEKELMIGALSSLAGSAIWLLLATALRLPISGTHSIVGATVGFSLVCRGTKGVRWIALAHIAASWFASPVLSGIVSFLIFWLLRKSVLRSSKPFEQGLNILPVAYGLTIAVNVMSIALDGPKLSNKYNGYLKEEETLLRKTVGIVSIVSNNYNVLMLDQMPWWGSLIAALLLGLVVAVIVYVFVVPWQRTRILLAMSDDREKAATHLGACDKKETTALSVITESPCGGSGGGGGGDGSNSNGNAKDVKLRGNSSESPLLMVAQAEEVENAQADCIAAEEEQPEVSRLFSFLQVLTAAFGSFAHGGNDVSNAIGPLIALWAVYSEGSAKQEAETPILILLYGGLGISTGLWVWGRRVIQTLGQDLARITPTTGFTIEVGAAVTVLLASKAGLPVSTTHCKVGSVVCVGWASRGGEGVSWKLFRNIAFAWLITVPMAGCLSAGCMAIFRRVISL
ncbi:Sodium-dependent phosphate transporter 1-A [Harpegnathos saltator]|uniref:Phosphate transporter n=1 Tax=Harpegnathos saltator TaxID=610380 RepID=E2BFZ5_HARSA|nr:Sodium-dependent phosphate transporter 1-A [Harpegnathos saltator]